MLWVSDDVDGLDSRYFAVKLILVGDPVTEPALEQTPETMTLISDPDISDVSMNHTRALERQDWNSGPLFPNYLRVLRRINNYIGPARRKDASMDCNSGLSTFVQ